MIVISHTVLLSPRNWMCPIRCSLALRWWLWL